MEDSSSAECSSCHKRMVPRVVFQGGEASHSICPFCGAQFKKFGYEPDPSMFALGHFLGRVWRAKKLEVLFSSALSKHGVTGAASRFIFRALKLGLLISAILVIKNTVH